MINNIEQKLRNKIEIINYKIAILKYKQKQIIRYSKSDIFNYNYLLYYI